jgi:hypothetical protein
VVFPFVVSRAIVLVLLVVAGSTQVSDPEDGTREADIVLPAPGDMIQHLRETVDIGDVGWYMAIALFGYEAGPFDSGDPHNWAFFPLFPLIVRAAYGVTGEAQMTGMLVSHICFFGALVVLHRYIVTRGGDTGTADRAVFYLAFFPSSYVFSLPLTESLFLLLSVGSIFAAERQRWIASGVLAGFTSATRVTGILLLAPLALLAWGSLRAAGWKSKFRSACLLFAPIGLLAYMLYLGQLTGNPFAFRDVQQAWGRALGMRQLVRAVVDYAVSPGLVAASWDFRLLNVAALLLALAAALVLAVRRDWALSAYTFVSVLVPLATGSLQSMNRYIVVLFPIVLVLGLVGRRPLVDQTIRAIFAVLMGLMTVLFASHFTLALA